MNIFSWSQYIHSSRFYGICPIFFWKTLFEKKLRGQIFSKKKFSEEKFSGKNLPKIYRENFSRKKVHKKYLGKHFSAKFLEKDFLNKKGKSGKYFLKSQTNTGETFCYIFRRLNKHEKNFPEKYFPANKGSLSVEINFLDTSRFTIFLNF